MELMSLFAKLTLDKEQYDKALEEAEKDAKDLKVPTPEIPKPETEEFKKGLDEAEGTGNLFVEVMRGVWDGLKDAIVTTGIVGLVSGIIGAMREGISLAINNGKAISDGAKKLQLSTKSYQEYEYILKKSNMGVKDLSTALKRMDELKGGQKLTEQQTKWLGELGVNAEEAADREELLAQTMAALSKYEGNDKGLIISWLFGSNQNWAGFFDQSEKEIKDLKKEADDLGYVMSDESIENAVKFNETTEKISTQIESIKRAFGESILPMITDAVNGIATIIAFFAGSGEKSLSDMWADDDKQFSKELITIEGTAAAAETLADKLLAMGDTSKMTADQYEIWKGTAESLIELVPSLGEVIDTETGQISANSDEIKENIKQWENLAKQKALQALKEKKYQDIVEKNEDLIEKSVEANKKAAEAEKARREAAGKFSEKMQEYGLGSLDMNGDIDQQISDVMSRLAAGGEQYESELLGLGVSLKQYGEASTEAGKAQADVDRLTEELKKGEEEYKNWVSTAEEMYGIQAEEAKSAASETEAYVKTLEGLPRHIKTTLELEYKGMNVPRPFATGSAYIPYDNFPALLHRGERVLTATENRRGSDSNVDFTAMEDKIIAAIRSGMEGATVRSYLNGKDITAEVSRENMQQVKARRFR